MADPLELTWIDEKAPSRIRKRPVWQDLIDEAAAREDDGDPGPPELPGQLVDPGTRARCSPCCRAARRWGTTA
ncbi:MAG: hypothetical protein R3B70_44825 [Polyangiaceae bacterium]